VWLLGNLEAPLVQGQHVVAAEETFHSTNRQFTHSKASESRNHLTIKVVSVVLLGAGGAVERLGPAEPDLAAGQADLVRARIDGSPLTATAALG
jgi:hypothetical protein